MGQGWPPSTPRHFWISFFLKKTLFGDNVHSFLENSFCKSRPRMAALANPYEAKCSYVDPPFFIFPPQPNQHLSFYIKIVTLASLFHEKTLFHVEPPLN